MKKKKHIHTKLVKFLIEKHLEDYDVDHVVEKPLPDDESEDVILSFDVLIRLDCVLGLQ
jgi:hypothetical protein